MAREEEEGRAGGPGAGPAGPPCPSPSGLAPAEEAPGGEAPLLECPLCLEAQPPSAFPGGGCCGGRACGGCLGRYLREAIRGSRVPVPCPLCPAPLRPDDVRRLLRLLSADEAEALRERYEAFLLRRALAAEPGARWCPAPDCSFALLAEGFAACPRLVCGRPQCGAAFCFLCRRPWPKDGRPCCPREAPQPPAEPHGAGKEKDDGAGRGRGKACESLRRCPRCRAPIAKAEDGGCNRMSCALCGCLFCWLCGREISELHFLGDLAEPAGAEQRLVINEPDALGKSQVQVLQQDCSAEETVLGRRAPQADSQVWKEEGKAPGESRERKRTEDKELSLKPSGSSS